MGGKKCHHLENLKAANGLDSYAFLYHHFVKTSPLIIGSSASTSAGGKCSTDQLPQSSVNPHLGGEALDLTELCFSETQTVDECNRAKVSSIIKWINNVQQTTVSQEC